MISILLVIHVLLSLTIIGLVMLQRGKGADAGAAFGAGASGTVFGARGSGNFLSKATTILAILFFIVCLSLAYLSSNREAPDSVTGSVTSQQQETAPAADSGVMQQGEDLPPVEGGGDAAGESDLPPVE